MLRRKDSKSALVAGLLVAAICVLSSCASTKVSDPASAPDAPSDAQLLDDSSKVAATEVDDSAAFADLNSAHPEKADKKAEAAATTADFTATPENGDTFYQAVGGETLRRVAIALYSDRAFSKKLLEKNPGLKGLKSLAADQKIYFDMDSVNPQPRLLTKDMLNRYAAPLSEKLLQAGERKGLAKDQVILQKGDTLQSLSRRLYGSSRYWPEIYLVNHDKIQNYDHVPVGLSLTVYNRGTAAPVAAAPALRAEKPSEVLAEVVETPAPPVRAANKHAKQAKAVPVVAPSAPALPIQPEPAPAPVATQPAPIVAAPARPVDPIPDTPPAAVKKKAPVVQKDDYVEEEGTSSANANLRRGLYMALILLIGGGAFYLTKAPKRTVDMLEINAEATAARPKLPKDGQKHHIG